MTWDDFMNSEYLFKSNTNKHIVEIKGSEFDENDDSTFVIYFNMFDGHIMVMLQHTTNKVDIPDAIRDMYTIAETERSDENGSSYTEVVFVLSTLHEALTD